MSEELAHYGIKGMKWGVRKGKSETGISRARGAVLDRNAVTKDALIKARSGEAFKLQKKIGEALIGKDQWEKNFQTTIRNLDAQNERLLSGKLNVSDRIAIMNTTPIELIISQRPRD